MIILYLLAHLAALSTPPQVVELIAQATVHRSGDSRQVLVSISNVGHRKVEEALVRTCGTTGEQTKLLEFGAVMPGEKRVGFINGVESACFIVGYTWDGKRAEFPLLVDASQANNSGLKLSESLPALAGIAGVMVGALLSHILNLKRIREERQTAWFESRIGSAVSVAEATLRGWRQSASKLQLRNEMDSFCKRSWLPSTLRKRISALREKLKLVSTEAECAEIEVDFANLLEDFILAPWRYV